VGSVCSTKAWGRCAEPLRLPLAQSLLTFSGCYPATPVKLLNVNPSGAADPESAANRPGVRLSYAALLACIVFPAIVAVLITTSLLEEETDDQNRSIRPALAMTNADRASVPRTRAMRGNPGPWGELEHVPIVIERPDEFVYFRFTDPAATVTRWFFGGYSREQLSSFLKSVDLTPEQQSLLLDISKWEQATNGVVVAPGKEIILGLSRSAREKIYSILADWPENNYQHNPYLFHVDDSEEWFENSGLSDQTLGFINGLLYQRGSTLCFSDLPEVYSSIEARERKRLMKTLSRRPTVLMKLHVKADTDVNRLVEYWGKGGRAKDLRPLLESLTRAPGGAAIDVIHLLPRFARMLVYTYPYPSNEPIAAGRNCFWTALNFFSEKPDDRFCDFREVEKEIQEAYYPILDEPIFGDVVFLVDQRGGAIHAAVYLADDMVFTKNGRHFSEPWRIMSVKAMLAEYPSNHRLQAVTYRLKRL